MTALCPISKIAKRAKSLHPIVHDLDDGGDVLFVDVVPGRWRCCFAR